LFLLRIIINIIIINIIIITKPLRKTLRNHRKTKQHKTLRLELLWNNSVSRSREPWPAEGKDSRAFKTVHMLL